MSTLSWRNTRHRACCRQEIWRVAQCAIHSHVPTGVGRLCRSSDRPQPLAPPKFSFHWLTERTHADHVGPAPARSSRAAPQPLSLVRVSSLAPQPSQKFTQFGSRWGRKNSRPQSPSCAVGARSADSIIVCQKRNSQGRAKLTPK